MRAITATLLLGIGCTGSGDDTTTLGTGNTTTTPGGGNDDMTISCAAQSDNVLRYDCSVTTTTAGALEVEWEAAADGTVRSTTTATAGTDHTVTIYAIKPLWDYDVRFSGPDGTATVSITPEQIPVSVGASTTGTGSTPVLVSLPCANEDAVAIVDVDGEPLWYQTYGNGGGRDGGYHFTPEGTVLVAFGHTVIETTLEGTELMRFERGVDFGDDPLHHDVHRGGNGLTYALFAEEVNNYVVDGVHIFDDSGLLDSWHLADEITPSGGGGGGGPGFWNNEFPGATDWSHGNSVHVDSDGSMYMSFRWLSAGMKVDGDPASGNFGAIEWALVGESGQAVASDFTLSSGIGGDADFIGQHHVNPTPDGRIALFDNRQSGQSRGIVMALDETNMTAEIQESWDVGQICSAQGATYVLDSGNALVTCATESEVYEFEPGGSSPVWTLTQDCGGGLAMLPRGIPADL